MSKKKRDIYDIDAETAKSMLIEDNMSSIEEIIKNDALIKAVEEAISGSLETK